MSRRRGRLNIKPNVAKAPTIATAKASTSACSLADTVPESTPSGSATVHDSKLPDSSLEAALCKASDNVASAAPGPDQVETCGNKGIEGHVAFTETPETEHVTESSHNLSSKAADESQPTTSDTQHDTSVKSPAEVRRVEKRQMRKVITLTVPVDRAKLTMKELIYMNPSSNPMKGAAGDAAHRKRRQQSHTDTEPPSPPAPDVTDTGSVAGEEEPDLAVPQVKVDAQGNVVLNEDSLVVRQPVVEDGAGMQLTDTTDDFFNGYAKRNRGPTWSTLETKKFFVALSCIGTDFSLMAKLFPKRSRTELKRKFKREEKHNRLLVEKCFSERHNFDMSAFDEIRALEEKEEQPAKKSRKTDTKPKVVRVRKTARKRPGLLYDTGSEDEDAQQDCPVSAASTAAAAALTDSLEPATAEQPLTSQQGEAGTDAREARQTRRDEAYIASSEDEESTAEVTTEVIKGPTRSGRLPRATLRYGQRLGGSDSEEDLGTEAPAVTRDQAESVAAETLVALATTPVTEPAAVDVVPGCEELVPGCEEAVPEAGLTVTLSALRTPRKSQDVFIPPAAVSSSQLSQSPARTQTADQSPTRTHKPEQSDAGSPSVSTLRGRRKKHFIPNFKKKS